MDRKRGEGWSSEARQSGEVAALVVDGGVILMDGDGEEAADEMQVTTVMSKA
jgi:hypothetical protein